MPDNVLFPVFDVPSTLAENSKPNTQTYNVAPLWDFQNNDFVTDGSGKLLYGSGYDAWVLWCKKSILTQRFAFLSYSENIGIESDESFKEPDRSAIESSFERTITEALLADPMGRTKQVNSFNFLWKSDSLYITCTVLGTDGNSAEISAQINQ